METKNSSPKPERAELPRISDRLTFIYAEHCSISRDDGAISLTDEDGTVNIPAAALTVLLAGPGTTVTHRAVQAMAETGMSIVWVGEQGVRYYHIIQHRILLAVFPAYAGVILPKTLLPSHRRRFPRPCGGDPTETAQEVGSWSFSPRMRG